jgi:hypothetical protein
MSRSILPSGIDYEDVRFLILRNCFLNAQIQADYFKALELVMGDLRAEMNDDEDFWSRSNNQPEEF